MDKMFAGVRVGRKNIIFGAGLFILLGFGFGIPLTIDMFGGSVLTSDQYQTWKAIHGYGVFLGIINYFFGLIIDRLSLTGSQKELASWSILAAGLFGGVIRMVLVMTSTLAVFGRAASLGETVFISLGIAIFILGQLGKSRRLAA